MSKEGTIDQHTVLTQTEVRYQLGPANKPQAKYTPLEFLYKCKPRLPTDISTLQHEMDGDESGAQEVRVEDLDAHMQAIIEWAEQVKAKRPNQTLNGSIYKEECKAQGTSHVGDKVYVDLQFTKGQLRGGS